MARNWAICIGINDYYNLKPLKYAQQDAEAMREFCLDEAKFEKVYYFAKGAPPIQADSGPSLRSEPTFANLKYFFRKRFAEPFLNVGDNVWFFFAGHGELHEGHDYLMPIDVDPDNVEDTALRISDITAYLRNSGADNTVLLLDACRSQGRRAAVGFGSDAQQGMVTIYACSPRESSYEIEAIQHGAFTHTLLEGFRLQGASNCATVERIDQYLRHQVPQLNQQHQKPVQTPYTAVEPLSKNCLILLPQRATLQDVQALKNAAYRAELEHNYTFAQQLWVRCLAASSADQDAIAAIGRIAVKQASQSETSSSSPTTAGSRSIVESVESTEIKSEAKIPPKAKPLPTFEFEVVTVDAKGKEISREQRSAEYHREALGHGVSLDMVMIPGGTFMMGSPDGEGDDREKPQHPVTVKPFLMGRYPVTQAQWRAVAALPKVERELKPDPSNFKGDNRPVEQVDWDDAMEFCQRLSNHTGRQYCLPSEAQWEYACRAGTTTPFYFGETITTDLANYRGTDFEYQGNTYPGFYGEGPRGNFRERITDVGSFPANAFGLCDMHGNVWEWCSDHWHKNYNGAPTDGSSWITGDDSSNRLLRGGSWGNDPAYCRSAVRIRIARDYRVNYVGFRVVCASART